MNGMQNAVILVLTLFCSTAWADQTNNPRYTFSWQLGQANAPAPRGGTTRASMESLATRA
jgi:hypothetical protein